MASKPDLPVIVTTDTSQDSEHQHPGIPASTTTGQTHSRSPSDPNYLAPGGTAAPRASSDEFPPSPTGSTASTVHFNTSVALRGNQPEKKSGMTSLSLLNPKGAFKHGRQNSAASLGSAEGTVADHGQTHTPSAYSASTSITASSPTTTKKNKHDEKGEKPHEDESSQEAAHSTRIPDVVDPTPFKYRPNQLVELIDSRKLQELHELGGTDAIVDGLGTDRAKGLSAHAVGQGAGEDGPSGGKGAFGASIADRQRVYGVNQMQARKSKTLLQLMWLAFKDKMLLFLTAAAIISLALGLYQDIGVHEFVPCPDDRTKNCPPPKVDFVEGVAIIIAVLIVVLVGSLNDWQKERQFRALNEKKDDRVVKVIRSGKEQQINIKEVLVGDVALLEPGEILPCDGIFLSGHNVKCDESGATGESDAIKKFSFEEAYAELEEKHETKKDCFLLSGSKVLEGVGSYVVIAIGPRSFSGRILLALQKDSEPTPLQSKLFRLAELIAKVGMACGIALFTALMIKFFVQLKTKTGRTANQKAMDFVQNLIISVTLVVVAVPEGLPLAVTLALAFATKRMTKEKLLVRVLDSCETMANATVVCTDKTGTLTQNVMSVVAGSVGVHAKFVKNLQENLNRADTGKGDKEDQRKHAQDFSIEQSELDKVLSPQLRFMFNQAIAVNSTAFEDKNQETGEVEFVGSKTETALLRFAKELNWPPYRETRDSAEIIQLLPFASERKYMGVIIKNGDRYRVYFKGASEILARLCRRHVVVGTPNQALAGTSETDKIETREIDSLANENINNTIIFYANQMLRTIALCYRDVDQWPPRGKAPDEVPLSELAQDLTLIGITGIEDPLRPGVREAVQDANRAGVVIKMCTGDNVLTARSIAAQCGIYKSGGIIMQGPDFRKLNKTELREVVPHLAVLARSSPEDKKLLVETLMEGGAIVGVTGDGTNDGPALKEANVGFSMGIAGTEVAKEASDIILMDDNFSSIVSAIMWGRCVNDSVRKFLQFQLSVNVTAVLITFISAVASDEEQSVLTAVQLLWINIIMDTFAALALATDPATRKLLDRKPDKKSAPLFNMQMGKMIIGQALYQTFIVLLFHFAGPSFFHVAHDDRALSTLVFNIFVFCQIFNSINCRTIDGSLNVFSGILKNWYFIGITLSEVVVQVIIVYVGGAAFTVKPISGKYWGISIALGIVSLPLGTCIRLIPNGPFEKLFIKLHWMKDPNALPTSQDEEKYNDAIEDVRSHLNMFSNIRGGRLRSSSISLKSRRIIPKASKGGSPKDLKGGLPNLMTMVPALIASSVGAGWQPTSRPLHDPANGDPSKSSAALWDGKIQLHPDTGSDHPAFAKWGAQVEKRQ